MTPALEFVGVTHAYADKLALRQVSFAVPQGQILCLLGASGCGKTTALRVAAGLEQPRGGQVLLGGRVVSGGDGFVPPEQRGVGLLFQDYALFPHLSVADNIGFGLRHLSAGQRRAEVAAWLQRIGLKDRGRAYPHMLSGGEQQRIALARALAPRPSVLLLDEPFSNLDSQLRQQVRAEVLQVLKDIGAAALLVTHDAEEALFMGDRIALMAQGEILQQGAALDLYFAPRNPKVASFFGETNQLAGWVKQDQVLTPLGPLPASGLAEGTPVEVVIRAEGLRLAPVSDDSDASPRAVVIKVQLLGAVSLIELQAEDGPQAAPTLLVRTLGASSLTPGARVRVVIDPDRAFVFPA